MKAISLWNPWAILAALELKKFETRSWDTPYRGPIAIHAAKTFPRDAKALCLEPPFYEHLRQAGLIGMTWPGHETDLFPLGAIVAIAILKETYLITENYMIQARPAPGEKPKMLYLPDEPERSFGDYTPGRFAWELDAVLRLPNPIPVRGGQRLWNWPFNFVPITGHISGRPEEPVCWGYCDETTGLRYLDDGSGNVRVITPEGVEI